MSNETAARSEKRDRLVAILRDMGSVLVAFSGGVDSSLLLRVAVDTLRENALAATATSPIYPPDEMAGARASAEAMGVRLLTLSTDELENPNFVSNPPDRCYHCKRELFSRLHALADQKGLKYVVDGSNFDDRNDHRPGSRAAAELGIRSPLQEAGLTKAEIRAWSRELGLGSWDKPSMACLASRVPYGESIDEGVLTKIEAAERFVRQQGLNLHQLRVRHHGDVARLEVARDDLPKITDPHVASTIADGLRSIGYLYVTVDLSGYRTGSLNEVLAELETRG